MSAPVVNSPLWWLEKLAPQLEARAGQMRTMDAYYNGHHPLPFVTKAHDAKMRDEFRALLEDARSNFMRLVVDATEECLRVDGFRLSAENDLLADEGAWTIWQANEMDAGSQDAFLESLIKGVSYLSVWSGDDYPVIAVEDPLETIVGYEPGSNYRRRAAAVKVWCDDWTGDRRANVYMPDGIYKFVEIEPDESSKAPSYGEEKVEDEKRWKELTNEFEINPVGVVPIIPLRNRPRLLCEGESELSDVFRVQNQINGLVFLLALAGYFGAHRQRWAVGMTLMEKDGKPVEPFDVAIDRLIVSENPNTQFGEFGQTDLDGYIKSIEQKVLHIAVTTRTPRHYLIQDGQSPSGDAIKSAESGLVKKVERKQRPFGESLEEAIRLARRFGGGKFPAEQDSPVTSETVWADPSTPTVAEMTDAAIKKYQAGLISAEQALEDCGYSQVQIHRMMSARTQDVLLSALTTPAPAAAAATEGTTTAAVA